jgi:hypothetical protein
MYNIMHPHYLMVNFFTYPLPVIICLFLCSCLELVQSALNTRKLEDIYGFDSLVKKEYTAISKNLVLDNLILELSLIALTNFHDAKCELCEKC